MYQYIHTEQDQGHDIYLDAIYYSHDILMGQKTEHGKKLFLYTALSLFNFITRFHDYMVYWTAHAPV